MKIAYADPPYLGCARKRYGDATYDRLSAHIALVEQLETGYDAWALSLHEPSLRHILPLCPQDVRTAVWVKPFAIFKKGVDPAYTWEPVIFRTARKWNREQNTVRDHISANITLKRGLTGVKPETFCFWLFELLGMSPDDEFHDLFPGTGAVTLAHQKWAAGKE